MNNLGYACINMTLGKKGILTGRAMRKATLDAKGLPYASQLALENAKDLKTILEWNVNHGIYFFRIGSDLFPWGNKIDITQLPDYNEIVKVLNDCGDYARMNNIRLTTHPGPFNLLASDKESVVLNTILDLEMHATLFDLLKLDQTPFNKINIHVGATYGNKEVAIYRWKQNFKRLSLSCQKRLTLENDDKASMYSVKDLYDSVYQDLGIPIVFDIHHHNFNTGDMTHKEAMALAGSTWPKGIRPVLHYSESKALHENNSKIKLQAHSDFISDYIQTYDNDVDVMIEAKAKELALLEYRKKYNI
jgi:UV DNA damage endonuclease